MAGKLIAVANMKGGVGKTTTVVSLAEALAADNPSASILVIDLDPQASASVCLAGDDLLSEMITKNRTLEDFLELRLLAARPGERRSTRSENPRSRKPHHASRQSAQNFASAVRTRPSNGRARNRL
jgi:cellulose biosynthesis protein BcsQ